MGGAEDIKLVQKQTRRTMRGVTRGDGGVASPVGKCTQGKEAVSIGSFGRKAHRTYAAQGWLKDTEARGWQ